MVSSLHKHYADIGHIDNVNPNPTFSSNRGNSDYTHTLKDPLTSLSQPDHQLTEKSLVAVIEESRPLMGPLNTTTLRNSEPFSATSHPNSLYS